MAQSSRTIAKPRIGSGTLVMWCGLVLVAFGAFAALAATDGGDGAAGTSIFCFGLGGSLVFGGSIVRMAHMLERRLIDIQAAIQGAQATEDVDDASSADGFIG